MANNHPLVSEVARALRQSGQESDAEGLLRYAKLARVFVHTHGVARVHEDPDVGSAFERTAKLHFGVDERELRRLMARLGAERHDAEEAYTNVRIDSDRAYYFAGLAMGLVAAQSGAGTVDAERASGAVAVRRRSKHRANARAGGRAGS